MEKLNINWTVQKRKVSDLKEWEKNPRKIDAVDFENLKKSIKERGFHDVLKIDVDGTIVSGHQRKRALKEMSIEEISVMVPDRKLTDTERDLIALESNLHRGSFDFDILANQFDDDIMLEAGFKDFEILKFNDGAITESEEDNVIPNVVEPTSKLGDLYELGSHRVLCGDSLEQAPVSRLCGANKVDMFLTDPPYNVAYVGKTKDALTIENDSMSDTKFREFLSTAFSNANEVMKAGSVFYIWHADSEGYNFRGACFDIGWKVRQCLVWNKSSLVMGRQDYHWKHEPCLYGWKEGASHLWNTDRKQTTVLDFVRPSRSKEHPTMKPVELMVYQITNNTKGEDIVLDLFAGGGSTLIASEKTGRICYGMELDPKYIDVIVQRWVDFTGNTKIKKNGIEIVWEVSKKKEE